MPSYHCSILGKYGMEETFTVCIHAWITDNGQWTVACELRYVRTTNRENRFQKQGYKPDSQYIRIHNVDCPCMVIGVCECMWPFNNDQHELGSQYHKQECRF